MADDARSNPQVVGALLTEYAGRGVFRRRPSTQSSQTAQIGFEHRQGPFTLDRDEAISHQFPARLDEVQQLLAFDVVEGEQYVAGVRCGCPDCRSWYISEILGWASLA